MLGGIAMSDVLEHKCPSCGASVVFDAKSQMITCPYCSTSFEVDEFADKSKEASENTVYYGENVAEVNRESETIYSESVESVDSDSKIGEPTEDSRETIDEEFQLFTCNSCGAELVCDDNTVATKCPYCDSEVIFTGRISEQLKPDFIIPFKIDKKSAKEALKKHYSNKFLLPRVFKDENHLDEIKGIYVPYWIFDYDISGEASFKAERRTYYSDAEYDYIQTDHYRIETEGNCAFDSIPADGSSKLDDKLMESVEPFIYEDSKDFQSIYLSGFLSDKYDVESKEVESIVKSRAENSLLNELRNKVHGYDSVNEFDHSFTVDSKHTRYAMMPVWILNTSWNGNKYKFAMNGQTGKFVGDLPIDYKKLTLVSVLSFFVFLAIGILIFLR